MIVCALYLVACTSYHVTPPDEPYLRSTRRNAKPQGVFGALRRTSPTLSLENIE